MWQEPERRVRADAGTPRLREQMSESKAEIRWTTPQSQALHRADCTAPNMRPIPKKVFKASRSGVDGSAVCRVEECM